VEVKNLKEKAYNEGKDSTGGNTVTDPAGFESLLDDGSMSGPVVIAPAGAREVRDKVVEKVYEDVLD